MTPALLEAREEGTINARAPDSAESCESGAIKEREEGTANDHNKSALVLREASILRSVLKIILI